MPAKASFTRAFAFDHTNMQRERKDDVAGWLTSAAYLTVLAIALGFGALLAWSLLRLAGRDEERPSRRDRAPAPTAPASA